ncbi:MAG: hypothetical protein KJ630_08065 [Proteobacteria bacterium]|nr:hypothetical protein [Pseudomonadota bacterium]
MNPDLGILDTIIKTLGAPGIILICLGGPSLVMAFMYSDHRRYERERLEAAKQEGIRQAQFVEERARSEARHLEEISKMEKQLMAIITQQDKRFEAVVKNYDNNVLLVEAYQKLAGELAGIIHMSTQVMTKLVEKIENNLFCPIVKDGGRNHGL